MAKKQHYSFGCVGRHTGGRVSKSGTTRKKRASPELAALAKAHNVTLNEAKDLLKLARKQWEKMSEESRIAHDIATIAASKRRQERAATRAATDVAQREENRLSRIAAYLESTEE